MHAPPSIVAHDSPVGVGERTRFTVVIPTRERYDTLYWTLQTCTGQDYDQLEILVSDNASQDETRAVVESFNDQRIRYINTGRRLSMTSNWEFALSQVHDSYVVYIGDDDGLIPGALTDLDHLIRQTGAEAVAWKKADYYWPSSWDDLFRNTLNLPLDRSLLQLRAAEQLANLLTFKTSYLELPCLYNSVVSLQAIQRANGASQRFFHSIIPDVYSGIALAAVIDRYVYSMRPYSINGVSGHSAGASFLYAFNVPRQTPVSMSVQADVEPNKAASLFFTENDLPFHDDLVRAPAVAIFTAESVLQARDHVPAARHLKIDIETVLAHAVREAAASPPEKYATIIEAVREIGHKHGLQDKVAKLLSRYPNLPQDRRPTMGYNLVYRSLRVPADRFGVSNVMAAAQLCRDILSLNESGYCSFPGLLRSSADFGAKLLRRWVSRNVREIGRRWRGGQTGSTTP